MFVPLSKTLIFNTSLLFVLFNILKIIRSRYHDILNMTYVLCDRCKFKGQVKHFVMDFPWEACLRYSSHAYQVYLQKNWCSFLKCLILIIDRTSWVMTSKVRDHMLLIMLLTSLHRYYSWIFRHHVVTSWGEWVNGSLCFCFWGWIHVGIYQVTGCTCNFHEANIVYLEMVRTRVKMCFVRKLAFVSIKK